MKKCLLSLVALLVATFAWAGTITLTTNSTASTWTGGASGYTTTINGWNLTYEKAASTSDCVAPSSDHIRVYKNAKFTIAPATASGEAIVKVVLSCTATNYSKTPSTDNGTVSASGTTVTWEGSANQVVLNATGSQLRIKTIEITTAASDAVLAPSISPNGGEYVVGDEVDVTIKAAAGQDVYYAINSDDVGDAEEYTDPLKVTSNTTIYAWATDGTTTSEAASATFNFTAPVADIAAFNALEKGKAAKFAGELTAVYQNSSNLIVQDASGRMLVYGSVGKTYNNGDVIAAGARGIVSAYGGNAQLSPVADSFAAGVAGTAVAPEVKAVTDLANCNFLDYVKLEGVYFTLDAGKTKNYTVSDGTNKFAAYNQFGITIEGLAEGAKFNVEGFMSSYNGTPQLQPTSVTLADASGITGVSSLKESFDSALPTTWASENVSGDKEWTYKSYSNNGYASMSAYGAEAVPVETWFISPALNVKDAELKTVSFKTQVNAYGTTSTQFKAYVLNDVDPAKATVKTELPAALAEAPESGFSAWVESGELDLSTYDDVVYVGFHYVAPEAASATWCIDDFMFNYVEEEPVVLGTKESPITVAEAMAAYVDGEEKEAWVTGYIVGCLDGSKDKPVFTTEGAVNTNVIIADDAKCNDVALCLPVQLPSGAVRTGLNLVNNPANLGAKITINGDIMKYFTIAGLKNSTEYVIVAPSAIEDVNADINAPVEYYNLQGVKVVNPENGIFIKKQAGKATKVVM